MAFPPGYLFQSSLSLYSSGGISGPRTRDLGRSSGGSAFAPYASTAFSHTAALNSIPFSSENAIPFPSYVGSYDHTPAVSGSMCYHPYGSLGPYPFGDPAYRKNTTRDATATLKAWLSEHRKNPYPTKGEKIMLAIITKMTLTQVSTWFANARRRLKKENKMSWTPRNRSEDEDDEDSIDLEKNDEDEEPQTSDVTKHSVVEDSLEKHTEDDPTSHVLIQSEEHENRTVPDLMASTSSPQNDIREGPRPPGENCTPTSVIHSVNPTPKPKLWSLAEMATSDKRCEEASSERFSPAGSPELCPYPPKHLFYTSAFRPGFTNYNAFGSLHESVPKHLNGIKQTVLNRDSRLPL